MVEMGLTPTDRWHLLGKHGCHYVDSAEFVEVREFDELELTHPEWGTLGVPSDPGGPDARWCRHCNDTIEEMRSRRYNTIGELKTVVPYRDVSWETVECVGDCQWCGKADSATQYDENLDDTVCPACAWKYNHGPDVEDPPKVDQRREPPTDIVEPVRYTYYTGNAERSPEESASAESREQARKRAADEQRPYVEVKIKGKYADVVCDLTGTGHRFTSGAIEEIESLQADEKDMTDANPDHKSYVMTDIGPGGTHVRTTTLFPDEARRHADDLAAMAADPSNWQ